MTREIDRLLARRHQRDGLALHCNRGCQLARFDLYDPRVLDDELNTFELHFGSYVESHSADLCAAHLKLDRRMNRVTDGVIEQIYLRFNIAFVFPFFCDLPKLLSLTPDLSNNSRHGLAERLSHKVQKSFADLVLRKAVERHSFLDRLKH